MKAAWGCVQGLVEATVFDEIQDREGTKGETKSDKGVHEILR
ncbi:hypothetical protein [Hyphobacterium sp.]